MIELIPPPADPIAYYAIAAVVALLAYVRLRADGRWFAPDAWVWWPIRRALMTPLDRVLERVPGLYATTTVPKTQHVARLDLSLSTVHDGLDRAGYEPQPLASIATDWLGRTERSSWARYHGPKVGRGILPDDLVDALPEWTRRRQVHVRTFAVDPAGPVDLAAHDEYNPFRPLLAFAHLTGVGLDGEAGVVHASADLLGVDLKPASAAPTET